ncbi:hypothetical protein GCM10010271_43510 [Streptomyces kurssanovii]|nr:hypothetical protein GCM10010271_43510 [Streptomyces kurssanovii]
MDPAGILSAAAKVERSRAAVVGPAAPGPVLRLAAARAVAGFASRRARACPPWPPGPARGVSGVGSGPVGARHAVPRWRFRPPARLRHRFTDPDPRPLTPDP